MQDLYNPHRDFSMPNKVLLIHRNLDFCPKGETILLNNCVAQIFQGTHTLNAVSVVGGEVIVVQDLSSSPTSYNPITEKFVYRIFPFN